VSIVSTGNRLPQIPQTVQAKTAEDAPLLGSATVYSTAALNLKKMRDRFAKAQMPSESIGKSKSSSFLV
jgi:hypothetical protein